MTDDRDPIQAAFDDHVPAPRDIVPRPPLEHSLDELAALAGKTVTVTHYDIDDDGVTKTVEQAAITHPITERNAGE